MFCHAAETTERLERVIFVEAVSCVEHHHGISEPTLVVFHRRNLARRLTALHIRFPDIVQLPKGVGEGVMREHPAKQLMDLGGPGL